MYLVAAHADRIVGKFDIRFGRIGCSNGYTAVIDRRVAGFDCRRRDRVTGNGRCGIAGAYGNAVAGRQGLGVYTIKTGEFRGQLNVKTVAGFVVYNTDVASVKLEVSAPPLRFKVSSLPSSIFSPESLTKLRLELLISPMLVLISLMLPAS